MTTTRRPTVRLDGIPPKLAEKLMAMHTAHHPDTQHVQRAERSSEDDCFRVQWRAVDGDYRFSTTSIGLSMTRENGAGRYETITLVDEELEVLAEVLRLWVQRYRSG